MHSFTASLDASGPNSSYGDFSGSTRVSSFTDWIATTQAALDIPLPSTTILMLLGLFGLINVRRN